MIKIGCYSLIWGLLISLLWGCSYKFVGEQKQTIFLEINNHSLGLRMGPLIDREVRKALLKSANLILCEERELADLSLKIEIADHHAVPESYNAQDTVIASSFSINSSFSITWQDRYGKTIFSEQHSANVSALSQNAQARPSDQQSRATLATQIASAIYMSWRKLP
jgi:hypothetical protein